MISLTAAVFTFIIFSCSSATDPGIQLNIYSQEEVSGCYVYNQTLGVCFDVKNGSIKLTRKSTGTVLAIFQDLGQNITLYQVLDKPFIRYVTYWKWLSSVGGSATDFNDFLIPRIQHDS